MNLRVGETFSFDLNAKDPVPPSPAAAGSQTQNIEAGRRVAAGHAPIFSTPPASRRYSLIVSMSARNVLNHTNPGPITGNITSPLFGFANQMYGTVNGEGFSENANNRRLEMQIRFRF